MKRKIEYLGRINLSINTLSNNSTSMNSCSKRIIMNLPSPYSRKYLNPLSSSWQPISSSPSKSSWASNRKTPNLIWTSDGSNGFHFSNQSTLKYGEEYDGQNLFSKINQCERVGRRENERISLLRPWALSLIEKARMHIWSL